MAYDREAAANLAYGLGIALYFDERTGRIGQYPPGIRIEPPKSAKPHYYDSSLPIITPGEPA
jgi:hypothetical protein